MGGAACTPHNAPSEGFRKPPKGAPGGPAHRYQRQVWACTGTLFLEVPVQASSGRHLGRGGPYENSLGPLLGCLGPHLGLLEILLAVPGVQFGFATETTGRRAPVVSVAGFIRASYRAAWGPVRAILDHFLGRLGPHLGLLVLLFGRPRRQVWVCNGDNRHKGSGCLRCRLPLGVIWGRLGAPCSCPGG